MRQKYQSPLTTMLATLGRRLFAGAACLTLMLLPAAQALGSTPTATRVSFTSGPGQNGKGAELTATVTTAIGDPVAGGTVDFVLQDGQSLGSAIVSASGEATLLLSSLPQESQTDMSGAKVVPLMAEYNAPVAATDATLTFADAHSAVTAVANPDATTATPDFTVSGNPTTVTVKAGDYGATVLTVTSVGSYTGSIEFSCSGLPAQVTCAFNPTQQSLTANGTFTSTLQLTTQATSGPQSSLLRGQGGVALALLFPGVLLLAFSGKRRLRSLQTLGVLLLVTGTGLGLSGCSQRYGYLHHPPLTATGTPAGTYSITVAVDGNLGASALEHDIPVSLVVQ